MGINTTNLSDLKVSRTQSTLTILISAGKLRNNNTILDVSSTNLTLPNNSTSYIEVNSTGSITQNTTGFTASRIPLAIVTTLDSKVSNINDRRTFLITATGEGGGGGGAPTSSSYVVLSADGTLTAERILAATNDLFLVDGGANNNITIKSSFARTFLFMGA